MTRFPGQWSTMVKRWAAAGMVNAERSFRRLKGCKHCKDCPRWGRARHAEAVKPTGDGAVPSTV